MFGGHLAILFYFDFRGSQFSPKQTVRGFYKRLLWCGMWEKWKVGGLGGGGKVSTREELGESGGGVERGETDIFVK